MLSLGPGPPGLRTVSTYTPVAAPASLALVRLKGLKHSYSCAYSRWGLRHGQSESCRGLPSVLLVHVCPRGLKHPYIHTTLAPLGACRHEGGWGGPERQAPASVSKHQNAASTGKRSKYRGAERSLRSKSFSAFSLARARFSPQFLLTGASRLSASRPTRVERVRTSGTPTLGAEAEAGKPAPIMRTASVFAPPQLPNPELGFMSLPLLVSGGCLTKG